jgi:hypothetical protein
MVQHAADDHSQSHSREELDRLRLHFGQLIWRLEEAALSHHESVQHSEDAVPPAKDVDWP